ncbi:MAG: phosphatase PAP2 family protein [Ignavibacteria bacterium]
MRTDRSISDAFFPEEVIAVIFSVPILVIQFIFILQHRITDVSSFITPLISFLIFTAYVIYLRKSKNRAVLFFRSWLHIPYYGIIFTAFQTFIHKLNPHDWDAFLLNTDKALFGTDITVWLEHFNSGIVTEILIIMYFSYYLLPTLSFVVFYFNKRSDNSYCDIRIFILALIIGWYLAFVFYAIFPASGPDSAFPGHYTTELKGLSPLTALYLDKVTSYLRESQVRNTFPSMHFGIILMVNYFAFKLRRRYFWLCTLPLGTGLGIATLYLRQHYLIDLVGSVFMAWFSIYLSGRLYKRKTSEVLKTSEV